MSSQSIFCYNNNSSYRNQIQVNEEYHKQFQKFPYKQNNDSIVESGTSLYISRRELSAKQDIITQENLQNKTILQALSEAEKEKHQKSEEYKMETSFQTLSNFKSQQNNAYQHKSYLQQTQEQNILNTVFNIEDADQKVEPIRLMKVLKLLVNIQHFFRILSMNARIFNKLNQNQHDLIGDVASVYSKSTKLKNGNKFFDLVLNYWYYMLIIAKNLNIQVFNPSNILIKVWDYLQSMLILFSTFLLNLQLFFEMDISNFQLLFQILFIVSVIDILVELNTGVLQKGDIIYDRNYIFKSYMQDTFFLNVIGNIPLFFFISKVEISTTVRIVFNILYTFNWVKISKVLKQIAYYASYEKGYKNMFDLLKLLVFVIGICHIFCLFWHGLCLFEINSGQQNNWIESKNLLDATIYERYIYSFYFLAVTMATVGYGDITPQNSAEVLFTTITIFVTCVVYAFSLNTIGSIIENIEKKDKKYKDNLQIIHGLMREEEVSRELKIQVSNYIEYLYKESNEIQKKQEKLIIEKLSTKLRNDLILEIQGKNYKFCSIFCSTCKSGNHFSIDCPRTHLTLTRQIVISRYNSCSPQERAEFKRRKSKILHNALLEINNKESLFEILDSLENGCNILDEADDETNVQFQDNSKEENIRKNLVDGTQNQLFFSSDNKNSQIENQNKSLSIEECQDKAQNQIIRQGKNNLTLIKQNSKGNRYNDKTIQMQQQQQQQNQVKKQFLYRSSQQYNPENKMIEQLQENQRQQQNESEKLPTSPTSSEDDSMSDCSFQYRKQKPSKDNAQLERPSLGKEDEQRFIIDEKIKEDAIQNNSAIQKRNSSIFYKMRGSNQLINSQINEISRQSLINDVKNNNEKQKEVVNNIQINNILQSRRTLRGTRDNIFLENVLKKIQNRSSLQVDEQNLQKKYSNTNFDDLQERLSKISLKDNPKKLSLQNQFQFLNSKSIQNTANILPQIIEENILINGKKGIDFIEYADQVNYQMLQTFDKAKIFKYYFPHFNYPEIVEKWVLFQSKRQQRILKSSKIAQKKKRYLNKRKQNNSSLYQKQTEI
ncbi:hypothetical protein ABPG74_007601 [Tetrahymena malaccensis]